MTAPSTARAVDVHALPAMLTALRLPSFHRHWPTMAGRADREAWPAARFLAALAEMEIAERDTRRIQRHLIESRLTGGRTLATFDFKALPSVPRARIEASAAGDRVETGANPIAIGNSGAGKTHLLCAVGHALIDAGRRVLDTRTTDPRAEAPGRSTRPRPRGGARQARPLRPDHPRRHQPRPQAETSVLFGLIARRYGTRSLAIAANQPFSAWDRIFPDKAVTAIDRLVHHATILEMSVDSCRRRTARRPNRRHRQPTHRKRRPPPLPMTSGRTSPPEPAAAAASTGQLACRSRTSRLTLDRSAPSKARSAGAMLRRDARKRHDRGGLRALLFRQPARRLHRRPDPAV